MARSRHSKAPESSASDLASPSGRRTIHGNNVDYGDRVAERAYELYLARGSADGRDFDDWLTAERELAKGHDLEGGSRE